ncbi:MAG: mucoidy inhibitor MuiA family protein [Bradymonadaceae bacterium]|nr:mucoidy inhibitor MuiA family protein [Lujinxingiaceae bacterium]
MSEKTGVEVSSRAQAVTFYEDRAQVVRSARVELGLGSHNVVIEGVTVLVDDPSLGVRARLVGAPGAEAVAVSAARVRRMVRMVNEMSSGEVDAIELRERECEGQVRRAKMALKMVKLERARLRQLEKRLLKEARYVPSAEASKPADWDDAFAQLEAAIAKTYESADAAREAIGEATRAHERAQLLLDQARARHPEYLALIEVQLEVTTGGTVELELDYFTPCALWRPSHLARLVREPMARLEIGTLATVWQATGEQWEGVTCRFSTARVGKAAEPPRLDDDVISARAKSDEERRVVNVEARDLTIGSTYVGGARAVDEMPGVDDGGEPLCFEASGPVTIPSNGEPFRVEISVTELACEVERVAFAELSGVPHLRARATWKGEHALLAGPVALMREGEFAGRSSIEFVGVGEAFEIGFGVESALRVSRRVDDKHETTKITGKNLLTRTVNLFVSNLSGEPKQLELLERIPVSEIDDVVINVLDDGYRPDTDGFVHIKLKLAARETLTRTFRYRVEYASNVNLRL